MSNSEAEGTRSWAVEEVVRLLRGTGHLPPALAVPTSPPGPDARVDGDVLLQDGRRLRIDVKRLGTLRIEDLRGRLALGLVQLRANAARCGPPAQDVVPLVVLVVPGITRPAAEAARSFMAEYGQDAGWALMAEPGRAESVPVLLRIPALGVEVEERPRQFETATPRRSTRLFSDLNRWMLKVFLLRTAPAGMWSGPREDVRSVRQLATIASVSLGAAQRFVRTFEEQGFLRATREGVTLVRRGELLRAWLAVEAAEPVAHAPVRWIFGRPTDLRQVIGAGVDGPTYVIGGFEAARRLGVLRAVGDGPPLIHVARKDHRLFEAWNVEACDPRDAHLRLSEMRYADAVTRGAVTLDGLRVVDVLQSALDVVGDPGRGREQADYVLQHVVGLEDA